MRAPIRTIICDTKYVLEFLSTPARLGYRPRNLAASLLGAVALSGLWAIPAASETPSQVEVDTQVDGVHVARSRQSDVDEAALIAAVEDARFDGLRIVISVPRDPQPDAASFARRVQEKTDADIALVFPEEGPLESYVIEDLEEHHTRAITTARTRSSPVDATATFVAEITTDPDIETPAIIGQVVSAVILFGLGLGLLVGAEQLISWLRRRRDETSSSDDEKQDLRPPGPESTSDEPALLDS